MQVDKPGAQMAEYVTSLRDLLHSKQENISVLLSKLSSFEGKLQQQDRLDGRR